MALLSNRGLAVLMLPLALACIGAAASPGRMDATPLAKVTLHPYAETDSEEVRLGDIADISGSDSAMLERLRDLRLGSLSRGRAVLSRDALRRWVRVKAGIDGRELAWAGTTEVQMKRRVSQVENGPIVAAGRELLARTFAPLRGRVVIEPEPGEAKFELPVGRLQFRARTLPHGVSPTTHMLVWVDVSANGQFVRAVPMRFAVSVFVPAWTVKAPATAGTRIADGDVVACELDLALEPARGRVRRQEDTFIEPGQAVLLRQDVAPGQALTWKNAVEPPLVARGETAKLRLHGATLDLESSVKVLQDGLLGQAVKVRPTGATGPITAKVVGPGILEAQL
ncbi:MAG: flagella basal body P-ring formation protein FlgA [Massilia sp.]